MVTVSSQSLSSKWKLLGKQTWASIAGTWASNAKQWNINVVEPVSFNESITKKTFLNNPEKINVKPTYIDNRQFVLRIVEQIGFVSQLRKWFYRTPCESLVLSEKPCKNLESQIKEKVSCVDSYSDHGHFSRLFNEHINTNDKHSLNPTLNNSDSFSIKDKQFLYFFENAKERLLIADIFDRRIILSRVFSETLNVANKLCKDILKPHSAYVNITGSVLQKSDAILSDIIISLVDIPTDVPADYEPWRPFVSGDYTYRDALIKCKMSALKTEARLLLSEYKIFVDLPDIQDHAITKIKAEKTWIPFTLEFYRVPEVTITMAGGTDKVVIPYIIDVDPSGFHVELRDSAGNLSAGTISWQALGC